MTTRIHMLPLTDPTWKELEHAYGSGDEIAAYLRKLRDNFKSRDVESDDEDDDEFDLSHLCHQWSTYDGTFAAIPHLIDICRQQPADSLARIDLLSQVGWFVACLRLNETKAPANLMQWFEESLPLAARLIAESLPFVNEDSEEGPPLRDVLAAFAACRGNAPLAFILSELESGGVQCGKCRAPFEPMRSGLNPFWVERKGKDRAVAGDDETE